MKLRKGNVFTPVCQSFMGGKACVAGGMHGGGTCMVGGVRGRGHAWQGACVMGGIAWQGEVCVAGETATAADGTHPTGMLSYQCHVFQ